MRALPLLLLTLGACATRPSASGPAPLTPGTPSGPNTPAPQPPAAPMTPTHTLTLDQRAPLELGSTATLRYEGLVIEDIAGSPDGSYPGGSGISLTVIVDGGATPQRRQLSLLSAGYTSRPSAWFDRHRVTLLDVEDPYKKGARALFVVERVSDRTRPGPPVVVRVAAGQSIDLDDEIRVEFLGNSTKEISAGEKPPLMVAVKYHVPGEPPDSTEFNVGADDTPQSSTWRDDRLTIVESAYNAWMRVSIERLQLERVTPAGPG